MRSRMFRSWIAMAAFVTVLAPAALAFAEVAGRGDVNADGAVDVSDPVFLLSFLFQGGRPPACDLAADANANGDLDISDAIYILNFLFNGTNDLPRLSKDEIQNCREAVRVLRHGRFVTLHHGVSGTVEHLSDGTIRLSRFHYDGGGLPEVFVWLHAGLGREWAGWGISEDLRGDPYEGVTLEYPIPAEVTPEMFEHVSIWCTSFPLNYGYARLFR